MPLNSDPNATIPVWLASDDATPADKRTTWHARFLTVRQSNKIASLWEQHDGATSLDVKADIVDEILSVAIVRHERWTFDGNVLPQDAKPSEYLTRDELYELAGAVLRKQRPTDDEGKPSALPPASGGEPTANLAPASAASTPPAVTQS